MARVFVHVCVSLACWLSAVGRRIRHNNSNDLTAISRQQFQAPTRVQEGASAGGSQSEQLEKCQRALEILQEELSSTKPWTTKLAPGSFTVATEEGWSAGVKFYVFVLLSDARKFFDTLWTTRALFDADGTELASNSGGNPFALGTIRETFSTKFLEALDADMIRRGSDDFSLSAEVAPVSQEPRNFLSGATLVQEEYCLDLRRAFGDDPTIFKFSLRTQSVKILGRFTDLNVRRLTLDCSIRKRMGEEKFSVIIGQSGEARIDMTLHGLKIQKGLAQEHATHIEFDELTVELSRKDDTQPFLSLDIDLTRNQHGSADLMLGAMAANWNFEKLESSAPADAGLLSRVGVWAIKMTDRLGLASWGSIQALITSFLSTAVQHIIKGFLPSDYSAAKLRDHVRLDIDVRVESITVVDGVLSASIALRAVNLKLGEDHRPFSAVIDSFNKDFTNHAFSERFGAATDSMFALLDGGNAATLNLERVLLRPGREELEGPLLHAAGALSGVAGISGQESLSFGVTFDILKKIHAYVDAVGGEMTTRDLDLAHRHWKHACMVQYFGGKKILPLLHLLFFDNAKVPTLRKVLKSIRLAIGFMSISTEGGWGLNFPSDFETYGDESVEPKLLIDNLNVRDFVNIFPVGWFP